MEPLIFSSSASTSLLDKNNTLWQAQQLLDEVSRFRAGHEDGRGLSRDSIPLVITGDFNATPHSSPDKDGDGVYQPMCYRQVMSHPLALRSAFHVQETFTTWKIRPLRSGTAHGCNGAVGYPSAAAGGDSTGGDRETKESKHCIDYVFISSTVQLERRSTLPSGEELGPRRAPSFVYPSDHFAMAVNLRLPNASADWSTS